MLAWAWVDGAWVGMLAQLNKPRLGLEQEQVCSYHQSPTLYTPSVLRDEIDVHGKNPESPS